MVSPSNIGDPRERKCLHRLLVRAALQCSACHQSLVTTRKSDNC